RSNCAEWPTACSSSARVASQGKSSAPISVTRRCSSTPTNRRETGNDTYEACWQHVRQTRGKRPFRTPERRVGRKQSGAEHTMSETYKPRVGTDNQRYETEAGRAVRIRQILGRGGPLIVLLLLAL